MSFRTSKGPMHIHCTHLIVLLLLSFSISYSSSSLLFKVSDLAFVFSSSNVLAIPLETSSVEAQKCMDQRPCENENRGCGPCNDLSLQHLAWSKTIEPRTGVEFPTLLDYTISGDSNYNFTPEVVTHL